MKDVFRKYSEYILRKYIANGYQRVEFRALLNGLKEYDAEGNVVSELGDRSFA
jgi:hypothetical protein